MKIKFENKYEISMKFLREFYMGLFFKKKLSFYMYIASAALILINAYRYISNGTWSIGSLEALIVVCGITILYNCAILLTINSAAKSNYKSMQEVVKGQPCFSDIKVSDKYEITHSITGKSVSFNFNPVSSIKVTKNLIMLQMTKDKWLTFRKDSFTVGTFDGFKSFLNTCYPGYKIK